MIEALLQPLSEWSVAAALREPGAAYPLLNAAHIFSIGLIIGAIVTLDLRLLGLFQAYAVGALGPPLSRVAAIGITLAVISGFLLFVTQPVTYAGNPAFLIKLALVALGIANALILRFLPHWQRALAGGEVDIALKLPALFSLLIWVGALVSGRWIGFL